MNALRCVFKHISNTSKSLICYFSFGLPVSQVQVAQEYSSLNTWGCAYLQPKMSKCFVIITKLSFSKILLKHIKSFDMLFQFWASCVTGSPREYTCSRLNTWGPADLQPNFSKCIYHNKTKLLLTILLKHIKSFWYGIL